MSSPHFYQAEQKFVEAVFGMRPDKQQHQTAIDINPVGNPQLVPTSPAFILSAPGCSWWEDLLSPTRWRCDLQFQTSLTAAVPDTELSPKISSDEAYQALSCNNAVEHAVNPEKKRNSLKRHRFCSALPLECLIATVFQITSLV